MAKRIPELLPHVNTDNARIELLSLDISSEACKIATNSKTENNWKIDSLADRKYHIRKILICSRCEKKRAPPEWQKSQAHTTQIQRCRLSLERLNKKECSSSLLYTVYTATHRDSKTSTPSTRLLFAVCLAIYSIHSFPIWYQQLECRVSMPTQLVPATNF